MTDVETLSDPSQKSEKLLKYLPTNMEMRNRVGIPDGLLITIYMNKSNIDNKHLSFGKKKF